MTQNKDTQPKPDRQEMSFTLYKITKPLVVLSTWYVCRASTELRGKCRDLIMQLQPNKSLLFWVL